MSTRPLPPTVIRLDDGLTRIRGARITHRDERLLAMLRWNRGESLPQAARAFSTRPLVRKHGDRKRTDRMRGDS